MMILSLLIAILAVAGGIILIRYLRGGHGEASWVAKVSGDLMDLHLNVRKLPPEARQKFFSEASALYQSTKGTFHRKRLAMRFFGWYATEYSGPDIRSFTVEGAVSGAIPIIREWARKDKSLKEAAEAEIQKIGMFLYRAFENMPIPEEEKIEAQLNLLQMMGAKMPISEGSAPK